MPRKVALNFLAGLIIHTLVSCRCSSFCVMSESQCHGAPAETPSAAIATLGMTGDTPAKWPQNFLINGE